LKGVTRQQAEQITQYVNDCSIWRLTAKETAEYLALKGFPVDIRTLGFEIYVKGYDQTVNTLLNDPLS
jgi:hypothetical protein